MNIVYIVMIHEKIHLANELISVLLKDVDAKVVLHIDSKFSLSEKDLLPDANESIKARVFYAERTHVEWGEWGMIEACLNCFALLNKQKIEYNYAILLSGACFPIKPVVQLKEFLSLNNGLNYIEHINASEQRWVFDGIQKERWELYHYINWRKRPILFSKAINLQTKFKIKRKLPDNFIPHMGSQWWALSKDTVDQVYEYSLSSNVKSFYKKTWIPDELYFQTVVANIIDSNKLSNTNLTYYHFDLRGAPKVLYDSHISELIHTKDKFFARKLSPNAKLLRKDLAEIYEMNTEEFQEIQLEYKDHSDETLSIVNRVLTPQASEAAKLDAFLDKFFIVIGDVDYQLKEIQNAINDNVEYYCHGLLYKEGELGYHPEFSGYKKQLNLADENFVIDDLLDVLTQVPEGRKVGFLLNYPNPESPKLLNHIIESGNAVIFHILTTEANYINKSYYADDYQKVEELASSNLVNDLEIQKLRDKVFEKHFTYDFDFSQWVDAKSCEYHQFWYYSNNDWIDQFMSFFDFHFL